MHENTSHDRSTVGRKRKDSAVSDDVTGKQGTWGEIKQKIHAEDDAQVEELDSSSYGDIRFPATPLSMVRTIGEGDEHEPLPIERHHQDRKSSKQKNSGHSHFKETNPRNTPDQNLRILTLKDESVLRNTPYDGAFISSEEQKTAKDLDLETRLESRRRGQAETQTPSLSRIQKRDAENPKDKLRNRTKLAPSYQEGIIAKLYSQCSSTIVAFMDIYKRTPDAIEAPLASMLGVMSERLFLWGESLEPADIEFLTLWSCDLREAIMQYLIDISQGIIRGLACQIKLRPEHEFHARVAQLTSGLSKGAGWDLPSEGQTFDPENGEDLADLIDDMNTSVECLMDLNPSIVRVLRQRDAIRFTESDGASATELEIESSLDQNPAHLDPADRKSVV